MVVIVVLEIRLTPLSLLKKNNLQSLKTEGFLIKNPHNYRRTSQVTSRYQEESQKGTPPKHVPMELQPEIISSLEQTEHFQLHDANSTFESQQDRLHRNPKTYKCEECQRIFKYPCRLSAHQKIHKKKRSFFCPRCHKGFPTLSDLRVHEVIHRQSKPFQCSTCGRSFSSQTKLQTHERIHTGQKPCTGSVCNRSFGQSSTYHRQWSSCHRSD